MTWVIVNDVITCVRVVIAYILLYLFSGAHNRETSGTIYRLSKIILHEDYSNVQNDVALLKLAVKVTLDDKVGTICLPKQDDRIPNGKNCYMTGMTNSCFLLNVYL
jgi:hypothetical protein